MAIKTVKKADLVSRVVNKNGKIKGLFSPVVTSLFVAFRLGEMLVIKAVSGNDKAVSFLQICLQARLEGKKQDAIALPEGLAESGFSSAASISNFAFASNAKFDAESFLAVIKDQTVTKELAGLVDAIHAEYTYMQ
jgi:hypothetical protein